MVLAAPGEMAAAFSECFSKTSLTSVCSLLSLFFRRVRRSLCLDRVSRCGGSWQGADSRSHGSGRDLTCLCRVKIISRHWSQLIFYRVLYHCSLKLPSLNCILNPSYHHKPQGINSLDVMVQLGKTDVINLQ